MHRSRGRQKGAIDSELMVVVLAGLYPPAKHGGGPIRTLEALVQLAPDDVRLAVVAGDQDLGSYERLGVPRNSWTLRDGVRCYYVSADQPGRLLRMWREVAGLRPDLVYLNSFFSVQFSIVPQLLRRIGWCRGSTILLAPRGEFSAGALGLKSGKKRMYMRFYLALGFDRRVIWQASSSNERTDIRAIWGSNQRVIIHEDETLLPIKACASVLSAGNGLRVIFLGRISPMKGLDVLLQAVIKAGGGILLDIYGPEEDPVYSRRCRRLAAGSPGTVVVRFLGAVDPKVVRSVFARYDLFALPTAGENFCHAIAESLSVGTPVMCTDRTPWTERLLAGGGTVVNSRAPQDWTHAIDEYARLDSSVLNDRRIGAARAYESWRTEDKGAHIFHTAR